MKRITFNKRVFSEFKNGTAIVAKRDVAKHLQGFKHAVKTDSGKQYEFRNDHGEGMIVKCPYGLNGGLIDVGEALINNGEVKARVISANVERKHVGVGDMDNPWVWVIKLEACDDTE
jgi:hypothetical protein